MKTLINNLLFFLILCYSCVGCKKGEKFDQHEYLTAHVNTNVFTSDYCFSFLADSSIVVRSYLNAKTYNDTAYPMIELRLWKFREGVYNYILGDSSTAYYYRTPADVVQAVAGSVNITWISPYPAFGAMGFNGIFNFVCPDSTRISDGAFYAAPWFYMH